MVRTGGSHPPNRGSIPRTATIKSVSSVGRSLWYLGRMNTPAMPAGALAKVGVATIKSPGSKFEFIYSFYCRDAAYP